MTKLEVSNPAGGDWETEIKIDDAVIKNATRLVLTIWPKDPPRLVISSIEKPNVVTGKDGNPKINEQRTVYRVSDFNLEATLCQKPGAE